MWVKWLNTSKNIYKVFQIRKNMVNKLVTTKTLNTVKPVTSPFNVMLTHGKM